MIYKLLAMVNFLDLQKITQKYSEDIHEAVNRVIEFGWYLQGKENEKFETVMLHILVRNMQLVVLMVGGTV